MIEVVEYDESWPGMFADLRTRYEQMLDGAPVVAIEHVGSTSVPGLAAKPVIDVDIVVERDDVEAILATLAAAGFESLGELGVIDRHAVRLPDDPIRTNTYVVVNGSLPLRNHLGVREVLRSDPALRAEYGALKQRLVGETDDIEVYIEGKSPVLQRILERAGVSAVDRAAIADVNLASREPVRE